MSIFTKKKTTVNAGLSAAFQAFTITAKDIYHCNQTDFKLEVSATKRPFVKVQFPDIKLQDFWISHTNLFNLPICKYTMIDWWLIVDISHQILDLILLSSSLISPPAITPPLLFPRAVEIPAALSSPWDFLSLFLLPLPSSLFASPTFLPSLLHLTLLSQFSWGSCVV